MAITDTHPIFTKNNRYWRLFSDCYAATPDFPRLIHPVTGQPYLDKYYLESPESYAFRLSRCSVVDLCAPAVDLLSGMISNIDISVPDSMNELMDDVDLRGTSLDQFMTDARTKACVHGHVFIFVDSTRAVSEITTQADIVREGIRPYLSVLLPSQVSNWRTDQHGRLTEIVFTVTPAPSTSLLESEQQPVTEYRYWSTSEWRVYRRTGNDQALVDQGSNQTGVIPVAVLYHKFVAPMLGDSLLKTSANLMVQLTRWLSDLDKIQTMQSHNQAWLRSEKTPTEVKFGSSTCLHLAPSKKDGDIVYGQEEAGYLAPDPAPLELSWNSFQKVHAMALKAMSLPEEVSRQGSSKGTPESGVAKAYSWRQTEKLLKTMSTNEMECVKNVLYFASLWMGISDAEIDVRYPSTFDLASLQDSIDQMLSLMAAGVPVVARRELMRSALAKALPDLPPDRQTEISDALDQMVAVADTVRAFTAPSADHKPTDKTNN